MTDPRATALADQAQAAWTDARTFLRHVASLAGVPPVQARLGPHGLKLAKTLAERGVAGGITLCPHLDYEHPAPAAWCAYAPGRLRCIPCSLTAMTRIRGTAEDRRCDSCRKTVPKPAMIYACQVVLPPMPDAVKNPSTGLLAPVPPITMHFGLCPACKADDGCWS